MVRSIWINGLENTLKTRVLRQKSAEMKLEQSAEIFSTDEVKVTTKSYEEIKQ